MKKKFLFMLLCSLFLFTGCEEKAENIDAKSDNQIDALVNIFNANKNITSGEVVLTLDITAVSKGTTINFNTPISLAMSSKENNILAKFSVGDNMLIGAMDAYLDANKESFNAYLPMSVLAKLSGEQTDATGWAKLGFKYSDLGVDLDTTKLETVKNVDTNKIKEAIGDNLTLVSSNGDINSYKLVVNDALIEKIAKMTNETYDEKDKMGMELVFEIDINKTKNEFVKISTDLSEIAKKETEDVTFSKFKLSLELKNVNNTTVEIPNDVKATATDLMEMLNSTLQEN